MLIYSFKKRKKEKQMHILNSNCFLRQKNKNKKKGKDDKYGSEVTTPENSSSPGMMDMHGNHAQLTNLTTHRSHVSARSLLLAAVIFIFSFGDIRIHSNALGFLSPQRKDWIILFYIPAQINSSI